MWNYRVMHRTDKPSDYYSIIEVYYDEDGKIDGWVDCAGSALIWSELEDLKGTVSMLLEAFNKPVLCWDGMNDKLTQEIE